MTNRPRSLLPTRTVMHQVGWNRCERTYSNCHVISRFYVGHGRIVDGYEVAPWDRLRTRPLQK
eukprot:scaffold758_cov104-Cylindrotheca_fusiformis.AAC.5